MAKKKSTRSESPALLKRKLERIDKDILKLIEERGDAAQKLIASGPEHADALPHPGRDADAVDALVQSYKGPMDPRTVRAIFRELIGGASSLRKRLRVSYLGPMYTYTHQAAVEFFGESHELVPVGTIAAVFEEVDRRHSQFGVVPLENSTDGRVADTLDMFTRLQVRICGEVQLRIHHFLLGRCPRAEVAEVYSKPQALSQCRNWLARHLPAARTIEVTSTAKAAQLAAEKQGAAAIASMHASTHYGLDVLAERIEDNPSNVTRFAVIGHEVSARTGKDKTALMFEIEHKPGALADATAVLKRNKLNMTWIESFPIARPEGGYMFFVELQGHERDLKLKRAIEALGRKAIRLEVLGSYPASEPVD